MVPWTTAALLLASTSVPTINAITAATITPRTGPLNHDPPNHEPPNLGPLSPDPPGPGPSGALSCTGGEGDSMVASAGDGDMLDCSRNRFSGIGRNTPRFMKMPLSNRKAASKYKFLRNACSLDLSSGSELASVLAVYFAVFSLRSPPLGIEKRA